MDLQNPRWMWLKAAGFVVIGCCCFALLWMGQPTLRTAVYLGLLVWASCRAYYFAFYVIEKYIDPRYRFSGLMDFLRYAWSRRGR